MHSTAHAYGKAFSIEPPHASAAAMHNAGRNRFPPAKSEYRIALCIVAGFTRSVGSDLSNARFTAALVRSKYAPISNA